MEGEKVEQDTSWSDKHIFLAVSREYKYAKCHNETTLGEIFIF